MQLRISSSFSFIAGLCFAAFVLLTAAIMTGCDSESTENQSPEAGSYSARDAVQSPVRKQPDAQPEPATPEPRIVTFEEAEATFRSRDFSQAAELFRAYAESNPNNPWGFYMLGLSATRVGNFELAEQSFNRSLELDPSHQKSLLNLARVYLNTGKGEIALGKILDAANTDVITAEVFRLKGRALSALGQTSEAEDAYREAIRLNETDTWAMNNLALLLLEQGYPDLAIPPLARAVELKPDEPVFWNNLGMTLEQEGQFREAEAAYSAAIAADVSHGKALINLARVELVEQNSDLPEVDLLALALEFKDEIASWSDEPIARERPLAVVIADSSQLQVEISDSTAVSAQQ